MKIIFRIVYTVVLILLLCGCSLSKMEKLNEEFVDINTSDIPTITIRTQMTENNPEEKVITDANEIEEIVNFLSNIEGESVKLEDANGWQFWILFEGYNISISGNRFEINNKEYELKNSVTDDFFNIYKESKAEARKYP